MEIGVLDVTVDVLDVRVVGLVVEFGVREVGDVEPVLEVVVLVGLVAVVGVRARMWRESGIVECGSCGM